MTRRLQVQSGKEMVLTIITGTIPCLEYLKHDSLDTFGT